jgi:glycosyltransferase involved in cell wall biosynthesis
LQLLAFSGYGSVIQDKDLVSGIEQVNISVVIPLYNKAAHIERCIKSVVNQTSPVSEIVVVNDGSTDNGREIVEAMLDPRIRLINQPNQGVSVARNRGTEEAKHDLVAFLDADDEWLPNYLTGIQTLIRNFPDCGAYATGVQTIRPNGEIFYPDLNKLPPEPWIGLIPNFFELFQDAISAFIPSSVVVPKKILQEVGGFPPGINLLEDIYCWVNIAIRHPIAFNPKRLVVYHQDASNRSNVHKNIDEEPFISVIKEAIKKGIISRELQVEAEEFISQRQIGTAVANVMEGKPSYARKLLASCRHTRKYKKRWLWWRFWASFPAGWPNMVLEFKQKIVGE